MTVVTLQLLAVCLCLRCKQRSLGNELRNLRTSVARIPTQRHVTLPWNHMTKNHMHESQTSCYAAGLQPSNHIREGVPESEHLGGSDYYNCKDRVKDLTTPSQSSLEGSDWDSEVITMKIINYCNAGNFCTSHNRYLQLHVLPHIPHTYYTHHTHHTPHSPHHTHSPHTHSLHPHSPHHTPHTTLTTHHTPHTTLTTHHTPLITHHMHTTHHTPLTTHHTTHHTPHTTLTTHHTPYHTPLSSHTTHHTTHHSSHTTHHTPYHTPHTTLTTHHSSHTTHHTPYHTPLITHHSPYTHHTHNYHTCTSHSHGNLQQGDARRGSPTNPRPHSS